MEYFQDYERKIPAVNDGDPVACVVTDDGMLWNYKAFHGAQLLLGTLADGTKGLFAKTIVPGDFASPAYVQMFESGAETVADPCVSVEG